MSNWEEVLKAGGRGLLLWSSGNWYPGVQTLRDALDEIASRRIVVVGLEGLNTDGKSIIPSMQHIADFSSIEGPRTERVRRSVVASANVLERWLGSVQFVAVTIDDEAGGDSAT